MNPRMWVVLVLALAALPGMARGQIAGNTHPEAHALAEFSGDSPFGAAAPSTMDARAKHAFSRRVDLGPLRDLSVFHNGRVKILGTLANESVRAITDRRDYIDYADTEGGKTRALHYDPLFTFFDLMIDPGYYADKPLLAVDYVPLREAILEQEFPADAERVAWWKRVGRLSPVALGRHVPELQTRYESDTRYRGAIARIRSRVELFRFSWRNLLLIAPESIDHEWRHVSDGGQIAGAQAIGPLVAEIGRAWRAGDADAVNAAAGALAEALPAVHSEMYPTVRRRIESAYNSVRPFEWGYWAYFLALIAMVLSFGTGRRWLAGTGLGFLAVALVLHGGGFIARCYIAERFAIQNQFESMMGLSLFAAIVGVGVMAARRQLLFGAAAAGVGFMVLIAGTQTAIPGREIEREAAILNTSYLLKYHVTTVLTSYGLIALGFVVSLFYLGTYYMQRARAADRLRRELRAGGAGGESAAAAEPRSHEAGPAGVSASALGLEADAPRGPARVLADLDRAQMIVLQLAFWALGVGILLGAWWADHSWGRWWGFDPKETWALITWIIYLIVIHVRFEVTGPRRAWLTAWLSVVGFGVMLFTYYGVNLVLPGLHAYA